MTVKIFSNIQIRNTHRAKKARWNNRLNHRETKRIQLNESVPNLNAPSKLTIPENREYLPTRGTDAIQGRREAGRCDVTVALQNRGSLTAPPLRKLCCARSEFELGPIVCVRVVVIPKRVSL